MRNVISLFGSSFVVTDSAVVTILRHSRDQGNCKKEKSCPIKKLSERYHPEQILYMLSPGN